MCFSATASFTAAAVLSLIGVASIKAVKKDKSLLFLAFVPLFFALQQAGEGLVWLNLTHGSESFSELGKYVFIIFAYIVWPVWIPLALWQAERITWRKKAIFLFLMAGVFWSVFQIYSLFDIDPKAHIVNNSIQYTADYYSETVLHFLTSTYMAIVLIPCFISSLNYLWLFGVLGFVSAFFSQQYYRETFTSVWCFFAALLSVMLYFILRDAVSRNTMNDPHG